MQSRVRASTATLLLAVLALLAGCGGSGAVSSPPSAAAPTVAATSPAPEPTAPPADAPATPPDGSPTASAAKPKVLATFSILGDLVQNVGGDRIELRTLVQPGTDAHTFAPSPSDGIAVVDANLIFENGLGFEPWLDDLYTSAESRATRVVVTQGIELIGAEEGQHAGEADEHGADHAAEGTPAAEHAGEADEHGHGEYDPHVWHDVGNVITMVATIRDALVAADPAGAAEYTANAERYLAELRALDAFVVEQTAALPEARRKLVTSHDTFGYFAHRYGYQVLGTALGSISTDITDPSAREIVDLVEQIKAAGVPAIFAENVHNPGLMEQIASETGVALAPTLYTDALGAPGSDGETYLKLVRYNLTTIVGALGK